MHTLVVLASMNSMHTYSSSIGPHRMHSKIVSQLRVVLQTNEL